VFDSGWVRRVAVVLAVAWMGLIFGLSSVHGSDVPGDFSTLAHFGVYAVLGGLYLYALPRGIRPWHAAALAVLLASLYGITDEFHQSFVPGRVPDVADWLVDTAGALVAVMAAEAVRRRIRARG